MSEEDVARSRRALALLLWGGFYRCPNSGKVIEALHGDDKALCACGKVNPSVPMEYPGVHVVRFLERVTVDVYIEEQTEKGEIA